VLGRHSFDRVAESSAGDALRSDQTHHQPEGTPLPVVVEERLGLRVLDGAEPVDAAEVVHAVHVPNPTAVTLLIFELFDRADRVLEVRAHVRSSVIAGIVVIGIGAFVIAPMAPQEPHAPPTVSREVRLTAAPALGAIPLVFIRNQFQYCSLICPFAVQGAITVPIAAAQSPAAFLGSLASTGSTLRAIGAAAASVTGPANAAITPLINNDVFLVVPKAFHALDVAIVEAINVGAAVVTPGELIQAVQNARTNILDALNQPVGPPTTPTGARTILQVVAVEAVNVTTAVAFQAGELLLAGVVQTADAAAQELTQSGDPAAALATGGTRARQVISAASAPVTSAVDTAVTNIRNSLHDPFPATATTTAPSRQALTVKTDESNKPAARTTKKSFESRRGKKDSDRTNVTSQTSATAADVEHPAKPEQKRHDPTRPKDGHGDNHRDAKPG
jgi:hypothetical protein